MWSKFAEVQCAFAVAEVRIVTADLRLRNTPCSFAEFAVAELSVNLRCPALKVKVTKLHLIYQYNWSVNTTNKKFQKITDFIHQYLIQNMTNDSEVCPVI